MRWPRTGIVVGVIGLVLLGAGWWLAAGSAGTARHARVSVVAQRMPALLLRQLQLWLAPPGRSPRPGFRLAPRAHDTTCFVGAGGLCSITPCVVPVAATPASACGSVVAPSQALRVSRPEPLARPATFRPSTP